MVVKSKILLAGLLQINRLEQKKINFNYGRKSAMKKHGQSFVILLIVMFAAVSLCACSTYKIAYRSELTEDPNLQEANDSYKKALRWIEDGDTVQSADRAKKSYATAESYIADTVFKLKTLGHDNEIDVSEEIYYCEKVHRETHNKKGLAARSGRKR